MSEKKHVTVTLTEQIVRAQNVCGAVDHYVNLLPAKISTDPEKNRVLALALAAHPLAADRPGDIEFLLWRMLKMCISRGHDPHANYPDGDYLGPADDLTTRASSDPMVIQQWLAWIADKLATDAGR